MYVGKLSGRAALNAQLKELGYELEPDQLARAFQLVKHVLGKKKALEEMDLRRCADIAISPTTGVEALALAEVSGENGHE
jgi:2-isopropylmalate synthase